jgi:AcrR family transcriptional regulator
MPSRATNSEQPKLPQRPLRLTLDRDFILRSALALIDRDGLDRLTMRRLSGELDVTPMALYRHVPNKAALLDGVSELIWRTAIRPARAKHGGDYRQQLERAMVRLRTELLRHPNAVSLLATHPLVTGGQLELVGVAIDLLKTSGMPVTTTTLYRLNNLAVFTFGHVLAEVAEPVGDADGEVDLAIRDEVVAAHPALREVLMPLIETRRTTSGYKVDHQFHLGLQALLAGWPDAG